MKLGKYAPLLLSVSISLLLIAVSSVSVRSIYAHDRENISHHILTRLQATTGLLELWQHDYLLGVHTIAEDPGFVEVVDNLLNNKIDAETAGTKLDQWLRPIYLGRGYDGHSIITPDMFIVLASSPSVARKPVVSPISRDVIAKALREGSAMGRPTETTYEVRMPDGTGPIGTLIQLGCAHITKGEKLLAVLCLRQDPARNFFAMLSTGFSGATGEAYAVDRQGNILSPTRFGQVIALNKTTTRGATPNYIKGLQARVPSKTRTGVMVRNKNNDPLTQGFNLAMQKGESGFIDGYADYRGVTVVGAVKWLPGMDIGIVVEQDANEVYGPFQFSSKAIIGLTALAIILINILMVVLIRSRKSLTEREQSMRTFLDNFPSFTHMRHRDGHFLIANKQMEKFLHVSRNQLTGKNIDAVNLPTEHINQLNRDHEQVLRTGQIVENIQQRTGASYGQGEWFKTIRFPVFDQETQEIYAVGTIVLDITEQTYNAQELEAIRVNLEKMVAQRTAEFEAAKLEAEQAAHVKSEFLANMSHEIRTPMNAIIGLSHLATLVSDDPKLRSYLERIHQSSQHLLTIINDILDFSKIEAGKMTLDNVDFSLEQTLANVLGLLWDKADEKGLELLLDIDPSLPDQLNGDALRLGQILINFTSNAVKFTETGEVLVRACKIDESETSVKVRFDVQDTGIGIPAENFAQLFTPFHQLDTSSTRRFEGTGLGLTISKNLVDLMEGELHIESKPGIGSTFSIELSFAKSATLKQDSFDTSLLHTKQVLLVDDNETARTLLEKHFRSLALEVTSVDSGAAALVLLEPQNGVTKSFDIILLDWKMPGLCGIETAEQIRLQALASHAQLVLLCTHNKQTLSANAELLFDALISKPIIRSELYETIINLFKNTYVRIEQKTSLDLSAYKKLAGCRVLLVDDNEINQDVVKELLYLISAKVITANNGKQALELLERLPFDIVLMDVQMPVMDGMEATRHLRIQERFDRLPIIAITAGALTGDREHCLNVGMNDYISKPIYPETLYGTMLRWYTPTAQPHSVAPQANIKDIKSTHESTRILSRLYRISGLDVDDALERLLNNETLYITIIKRFINERGTIVDDIESAIAEQNFDQARDQVHSFKSLAGTIGAVELQALALQIEVELQQKKLTEDLLYALRTALDRMQKELRMSLNI
jgi:two-component system sensor histidine kinase/response regulator